MSGREGSDGAPPSAIGRAVRRKEDARLLRGRACFVDDVRLDRMLHGVFVRSPHPHAGIGAVDSSAALAAGARLVLAAEDLPFADRAFVVRYWHEAIRGGTQPFLARNRVRYVGEPVALLVADDPYRAEDLSALVEVEYRPLDAVAGIEAAMADGAPALHESWTGNVAARFSYERGDAGRALERAARRVTHETRFARQIPLPLEKGKRLKGFAPHGRWRTMTFLAGLRTDGLSAPYVFDGPINGSCFQAWVEQLLVPTLRPGDIVILDNLGSHKGKAVRHAIRNAGARLWFLPAYSPDLNPIEQTFAKIKHWMRDAQKRSVDDTWRQLGHLIDTIQPDECQNYIRNAGYGSN